MRALITSILIAALLLSTFNLEAQRDREEKDRDRVESFSDFLDRTYVGGNVGGGLSQFYSFFEISPIAGYMLTDNLSAGVGFTYQYFQDKIKRYSSSIYGPKAFGRFQVIDWIFVYSEYEHLYLNYKEDASSDVFKAQSPNFLVGGGISSGGGDPRTGGYVMVLYNLNENEFTPYRNPVIRFGFTFGL